MPYVIAEPCIGVKDASCVDVCPVDCISTTEDAPQYYINPDQCIDCAACELACPVSAIFHEDSLPDQWQHFIQVNKEFFRERG
jgi:NAD-dependent dihydropyrimidine dehydrogenase PreA subunit